MNQRENKPCASIFRILCILLNMSIHMFSMQYPFFMANKMYGAEKTERSKRI